MKELTRVKFSNLDKILYPELELTKSDIIEYYIKVAPSLLPFLRDRALVRTRYPDGVNSEGFYEKDAPRGTPEWVQTYSKYSESADRYTDYVICNDVDTLVWLANLAALELHMPLSIVDNVGSPDLMLFDIDPEPPAGLSEAIRSALILRDYLEKIGLASFVKTSGKKGLHVMVPVVDGYTFKDTRSFVHAVAITLAEKHRFIVSERRQTKEPGTVLLDYPQNSERGTMIAPYSLRAVREATVSTPLNWRELPDLRPFDWNIFNVAEREKKPWKKLFHERFKLSL
ncbi:ATP-dependent DNA ligase [Candidatus Bathyarchaeota archaeon]|nr:ATP-dependent DNA ligase [Candidatus Bathyarchaeota archaeon]